MNDQTILNIIMGTALAVIGWFARQLWDAVQTLKEDMKSLEVDLPTNYVRKEEFESNLQKMLDSYTNFHPREFVLENLSPKVCMKRLLEQIMS